MTTKINTIRGKLWIMSGLFMANLITIALVQMWSSRVLTSDMQGLTTSITSTRSMTKVDMMHDGIRATIYKALFASETNNTEMVNQAAEELNEYSSDMIRYLGEIEALNVNTEIQALVLAEKAEIEGYKMAGQKVVDLILAGKRRQAIDELPEFNRIFESLEDNLGKLGDMVEAAGLAISTQAMKDSARADWINYSLLVLGLLAAFMTSGWVIRDMTRRMNAITDELSSEASTLNQVAEQINSASQNLAESTTQQSSAIEDTVTSMEEITSMIAQTAQNSNGTLTESETGRNEARKGKEVVTRMVASMDEISRANEQLQTIVKVMEDIKTRTRVINDIAFETKLLSFNASIEAARAGAHGRGFAVVAEEVGKLATVSSKAADEVRELLDSSTTKVGTIVEETKQRVSNGQNNSRECETAFVTMERTLESINRSVQLIATATREQEGGVKQTNQAMGEMEKATQSNARSADKLASQSQDLGRAAGSVHATVIRMREMIFGGSAKTTTPTVRDSSTPTKMSGGSSQKPVSAIPRMESNGSVLQIRPNAAGDAGDSTSSSSEKVSRNDKRWNVA